MYKVQSNIYMYVSVYYFSNSPFQGSEEKYPNFTQEIGDASSADGLLQPIHCHENDRIPWTESREKQLAKRKLIIASAVSLTFMVGEVIGKIINSFIDIEQP